MSFDSKLLEKQLNTTQLFFWLITQMNAFIFSEFKKKRISDSSATNTSLYVLKNSIVAREQQAAHL